DGRGLCRRSLRRAAHPHGRAHDHRGRAGPRFTGPFFRGFCRDRGDRRARQLRLPSGGLRLLNASVQGSRLGRAYSIHGVGGSLGWAAAPVMYFLDSLFGQGGAALIGAVPGLLLALLVWAHRSNLVDHRVKARTAAARHGSTPMLQLFMQPAILLCMVYFALLSVNTVGTQQFAVPAWTRMFGIGENYAALCLIVFIVGSAGGVLVGGVFADRVRRHDRVATLGLLVAGALTLPVAAQAVSPALLLPLLALTGAAGGITNPSRDMIVRSA